MSSLVNSNFRDVCQYVVDKCLYNNITTIDNIDPNITNYKDINALLRKTLDQSGMNGSLDTFQASCRLYFALGVVQIKQWENYSKHMIINPILNTLSKVSLFFSYYILAPIILSINPFSNHSVLSNTLKLEQATKAVTPEDQSSRSIIEPQKAVPHNESRSTSWAKSIWDFFFALEPSMEHMSDYAGIL